MDSLVDAYEKIAQEEELEMSKLAEEDAAGRIMARGFMDELNKIATPGFAPQPPPQSASRVPFAPKTDTTNLGVKPAAGIPNARPKSIVSMGKVRRVANPARSVVSMGKVRRVPNQ